MSVGIIRNSLYLGNYSNPTADEAVLDVMLEGAIKGLNSAEDALSDPALVQEFKRREHVIVMMADEYASFRRHLHALSVKEQEKDYYTLAEEAGVTVPVVRRKTSRIHCELISYMENYYIKESCEAIKLSTFSIKGKKL